MHLIMLKYISKLGCNRYAFSKICVKDIFENEATLNRIQAFQSIDYPEFLKLQNQNLQYQIKMPPTISMINAKQLRNYIKQKSIPQNIRILHALAHIQFNAFLAYADTALKFTNFIKQNDRQQFFREISQIGKEQSQHFVLLCKRMEELGYFYGSIPVISNLTETIWKSANNLKARLAAISIVHEGRGMKSICKLINKLRISQDHHSIPILQLIESQQTGHFLTGRKWLMKIMEEQNKVLDQLIEQINSQMNLQIKNSDFKFGVL